MMIRFRTSLVCRLLCLMVLHVALTGCGDDRPTVVLYVSADPHLARQVIDVFEQQSGIRVLMVSDTEEKKTAGLVERLRAERDHPRADVFWSSEIFMTIALAEDGVLEQHHSAVTESWPEVYRDSQNRWFAFAARARVIVFAPDRVPMEEVPATWMDLTRDRFRGRVVMADPRFGTTGGHLGAMKAFWDRHVMPGYYEAFLEGLAENEVRLLASGNAGVVEAVARGEADLGMTDTDDVWAAQARGLSVDLVYPAHSTELSQPGTGTLLIPNTVARVNGGPNPDTSASLIHFLLSEAVERTLAESVSHNVPLRPNLAADYPEFAVSDPLKIDYSEAARARLRAIELAMNKLAASSGSGSRKEVPASTAASPDVSTHAR